MVRRRSRRRRARASRAGCAARKATMGCTRASSPSRRRRQRAWTWRHCVTRGTICVERAFTMDVPPPPPDDDSRRDRRAAPASLVVPNNAAPSAPPARSTRANILHAHALTHTRTRNLHPRAGHERLRVHARATDDRRRRASSRWVLGPDRRLALMILRVCAAEPRLGSDATRAMNGIDAFRARSGVRRAASGAQRTLTRARAENTMKNFGRVPF